MLHRCLDPLNDDERVFDKVTDGRSPRLLIWPLPDNSSRRRATASPP